MSSIRRETHIGSNSQIVFLTASVISNDQNLLYSLATDIGHDIKLPLFVVYTNCDGNLTAKDDAQQIANPGYPDRYPNNIRCEYRISAPNPDQAVIITFDRFRTESCCDCLYVYDGEYSDPRCLLYNQGYSNNLHERALF